MRLHGREAIDYAERTGAILYKYADPIDGAGQTSVDTAREVAREDPGLVYVDEEGPLTLSRIPR